MYGSRRTQRPATSRHSSYAARPSYDYRRESSCSASDSGSESEGDQGYYSADEPDFSGAYGSGGRASGSARRGQGRGGMSGAGRMPRSSRNETRSSAAAPDRERPLPYTVEDPDGNIIDSFDGGDEDANDTDGTTSAGYGTRGSPRRRPNVSDYEDTPPRQRASARRDTYEHADTQTRPSQRGPGVYRDIHGNIIYVSGGTSGNGANTSGSYPSSRRNPSRRSTSEAYDRPTSEAYSRRGPEPRSSYREDDGYKPSARRAPSGSGGYTPSSRRAPSGSGSYRDSAHSGNNGGRRDYDRYGRRR